MTFQIGHTSLSNPDSRNFATERHCKACRGWFDARAFRDECPGCKAPRPEFNLKWRKPILDAHLHSQATSVR